MNSLRDRKKKLGDMVIDEIKRMIGRGELKAGDKLPNQTDFAAKLGVSRPSLRDAMNILTQMGVIEQKPGAGTVLISDSLEFWNEPPPPPMDGDVKAMLDLLEARREIESCMIRHAALRITEKELKGLAKSLDVMASAIEGKDTAVYQREDVSFHFQIAGACHNKYITHMFVTIKKIMDEFIKQSFEFMPNLMEDSLEHHRRIFDALKERNAKQAAHRLEQHILAVETSVRKYFGAEG